MTQTDAIRNHLERHGSLTPLDALQQYGCFRLAARIDELRKSGLFIKTEAEKRNGKSYARYTLIKQDNLFS